VEKLIQRKSSGETGPMVSMDFEDRFSDGMKNELMKPIDPADRGRMVSLPPNERDMDV